MWTMQRAVRSCLAGWGIFLLSGVVFTAAAQGSNPCESTSAATGGERGNLVSGGTGPAAPGITTHGLEPENFGQIVYDSNQGVCWLANANLAGNPAVQALMGVTGINPDGTMDYKTAGKWVEALKNYNGGLGFLGHANWQLPNNPIDDTTCSQFNYGNFGVSCTGSALGNLYTVGFGLSYPASVIPSFTSNVWPFKNLQSDLYWTTDPGANKGETTFSFNTGLNGSNTTVYNLFYELPLVRGAIGTPPAGTKGVVPYWTGPAAGKAVYDTVMGYTWVLDGNLAASENFGVTGKITLTSKINGKTYNPYLIDSAGAMFYSATEAWVAGMNAANYAGSQSWERPALADLLALYTDMDLPAGTTALEAHGSVGPFYNFQPGFYWACARDDGGNSQSPCDPKLFPVPNYIYSLNFNEGFEGTDKLDKQFYVMVYFPAE